MLTRTDKTQRFMAKREEGVVVFLIGLKVRKWWAIHRWLPIAIAFRRMMKELYANPDTGFLGALQSNTVTIQYWSSLEKLLAYANDKDGYHFAQWANFYRRIHQSAAVGLWHETYCAQPGSFESLYVRMPPIGLGTCAPLVPVNSRRIKENSS